MTVASGGPRKVIDGATVGPGRTHTNTAVVVGTATVVVVGGNVTADSLVEVAGTLDTGGWPLPGEVVAGVRNAGPLVDVAVPGAAGMVVVVGGMPDDVVGAGSGRVVVVGAAVNDGSGRNVGAGGAPAWPGRRPPLMTCTLTSAPSPPYQTTASR